MFGQEFNLWTDHQALSKTQVSESYDNIRDLTWLLNILWIDGYSGQTQQPKILINRALSNSWTFKSGCYLVMFCWIAERRGTEQHRRHLPRGAGAAPGEPLSNPVLPDPGSHGDFASALTRGGWGSPSDCAIWASKVAQW